jgi:hypothetical protein
MIVCLEIGGGVIAMYVNGGGELCVHTDFLTQQLAFHIVRFTSGL